MAIIRPGDMVTGPWPAGAAAWSFGDPVGPVGGPVGSPRRLVASRRSGLMESVVLNCQKYNQCHRGHKSLRLFFKGLFAIVMVCDQMSQRL